MATIAEIHRNLTWYKLNAAADDPMYNYMYEIYDEVYYNILKTVPIAKFALSESVVVDTSPILDYGTYPCHASAKQAFVDSSLSCFLFQFPFFLENIQFGYISMIFVIPILLISIFGGIKETYRWYFLNQAFWDFLVCYDFICEKPTILGWNYAKWPKTNSCVYYNNGSNPLLQYFFSAIRDCIRYSTFIPIFLITFSRFLSMYFPFFYKRTLAKNYITILFIIFFDICFILVLIIRSFINGFGRTITLANIQNCEKMYCAEFNNSFSTCNLKNQKMFNCFNQNIVTLQFLQRLARLIPNILIPVMFLAANIFATFLLYKLLSQLKFQLKNNRTNFISMAKISTVVLFQCFTMTLIFVVTAIQLYLQIFAFEMFEFEIYKYYIYKSIPPWLFFLQYYTTTACLNIIRVFLDSFIILTVLNGYSSCLIKFIKFIYFCIKNPKKAPGQIKNYFSNSSRVIVLSTTGTKLNK